jgi:hypothetical protein
MNPLATPYVARTHLLPHNYIHLRNYGRSNSTASSAGTNLRTSFDCAITDTSAHSTSPTLATNQLNQDMDRRFSSMTTYYEYNGYGYSVSTLSTPPVPEIVHVHPDVRSYEQRSDVVGAYLARRAMAYPTYAPSGTFQYGSFGDGGYGKQTSSPVESESTYQEYPAEHSYDSYSPQADGFTNFAEKIGYASFSDQSKFYPNPEDIRHLHTLVSLVPHLQPSRRFNSHDQDQMIDIVEQDTGVAFAYQVPKKMLVLFLGRSVVNRFIRTLERENSKNWKGAPVTQEMNIPRGIGSRSAFRILLSWTMRASRQDLAKGLR